MRVKGRGRERKGKERESGYEGMMLCCATMIRGELQRCRSKLDERRGGSGE